MKITKWNLLILVGLIIAVVIIYIGNIGIKQDAIRITYNPMPFNLPSMVEREQSFLEKQGFAVEYNSFLAGHAMSEALVAKELDIAVVMGGTSLITSVTGGRDLKIIAGYSQAPSGFALVSAVDGWTIEQLKGKKIAVPFGTEAHYLLGKILQEQGLTFSDIEAVNLLIPDGITALQSGQVDGSMAVEPVLTRLVQNNQIEIVRDGTGLITGLTVTVVPKDLQQDVIDKFLAAQKKSLDFIEDNFEMALQIASKETELPLAIVERIAPKYDFSMEITEEMKTTLADTIDFLYQQEIIREKLNVNQLF